MANPKITWDPDDSVVQSFTLSYPPVKKPGEYGTGLLLDDYYELDAVRTDTIASSGVKQSMYQRTDKFLTLQLDFIPQADMPSWQNFMHHALTGGQFDYYPDADLTEHATFTLEDTAFKPAYSFRRTNKMTLKFRLVVLDDSGS